MKNRESRLDTKAEREEQPIEKGTLVFENPEQAKGYTSISNSVLFDPRISPAAKTAYALLLSFAWQDNQSFPGQQRLAAVLGVTDRMVRHYLSELVTEGYIQVKRRGLGKTNIYVITDLTRSRRIAEEAKEATPWGAAEADRKPVSYQERKLVAGPERKPISYKQDSEEQDTDYSKFRRVENLEKKVDTAQSGTIAGIIENLSKRELHDPIHTHSNASRAMNLWRQSKLPEEEFVPLIHQAREITLAHSSQIRKTVAGSRGTKNRAPYFFSVLKHLMHKTVLTNFRARVGSRVI